jgi:hypothetical protein
MEFAKRVGFGIYATNRISGTEAVDMDLAYS